MGDVKHIRLTVWGARQTKIQDAIHYNLVPGGAVDYHRYSKGPDSSSFTVEVGGRVDVARLYECVKKIASSVKIEAVVPEDLKAKTTGQEQDLSKLKKFKDGENSNALLGTGQLEGYAVYRRHQISIEEVEVVAKFKMSEDGHRRIK